MWSQLRSAGWRRREPSGALRGGRARLVAAVVLSMAVMASTAAGTASAAAPGGDSSPVTIRFWPGGYTAVEGADPAMVTLALSEPLDRRLEVPVTWTLAANLGPGEFFPLSELVVFEAGETSKSFAVTAVHDGVADPLEFVTFGVIGDLPSDVRLVHPTYALVRFEDLVPVTAFFGANSYTAAEGGPAAEVTVRLSPAPNRRVVVPITAGRLGGADGGDHSAVPASLTFERGETSKSFGVTAFDDSHDDDDEFLLLGFGPLPVGVALGGFGLAFVALVDDDLPDVDMRFSDAFYEAVEGGDAARVTVVLNTAPERRLVVPIRVYERNGATPSDYSTVQSLTFESHETSKSFRVTATDDRAADGGEFLLVEFGPLPTGVALGGLGAVTVVLQDNDA